MRTKYKTARVWIRGRDAGWGGTWIGVGARRRNWATRAGFLMGSEAVLMKDQADGVMSVQRMGRSTWMVAMLCRTIPPDDISNSRAATDTGSRCAWPAGNKVIIDDVVRHFLNPWTTFNDLQLSRLVDSHPNTGLPTCTVLRLWDLPVSRLLPPNVQRFRFGQSLVTGPIIWVDWSLGFTWESLRGSNTMHEYIITSSPLHLNGQTSL